MPTNPATYELRKQRLGGAPRVQYPCPTCARKLHSPLDEAGQSDTCPDCGATFIVPGEAELATHRQAELAERKAAELEAAAKRKQTAQAQARALQAAAEPSWRDKPLAELTTRRYMLAIRWAVAEGILLAAGLLFLIALGVALVAAIVGSFIRQ